MKMDKMKPVKPPDELMDFLEISRFASALPVFPDIKKMIVVQNEQTLEEIESDPLKRREIEFNSHADESDWVQQSLKSTWNKISELSKEFGYRKLIDFISGSVPRHDHIVETSWLRYLDSFIERHRTIRSIAESVPKILSDTPWHGAEQITYFDESNEIISQEYILPFHIPIQPTLTKDGKISFLHDSFVEMLSGIDARRLRVCPICEYVFWAYQSHQKWCSAKCKRTASKRKTLADSDERARINKRRRENYQRNKKFNGLKEK